MKINIKILFTLLFTIFLSINMLDAQVRVVNEDGDVIILMPDGTWEYEDPQMEAERTDKNAPPPKNTVPATKQKLKTVKAEKAPNNSKKTSKSKKTKKSKKSKRKKSKEKKAASRSTSKKSSKKPKTVSNVSKSKKGKKRKAMIYPVPKRARKNKEPVIEDMTCQYSMKERDEFTNKLKVSVKPQEFFTYTQDDLKKFMREKDYMTCTGGLSKVIGITTFNVKFEMQSIMAQREYGEIQAGTQMLVKLLDGSTVTLTCQESSKGSIDEVNGKTVYRTYFGIDKGDEKKLKKSEVIKVRMLWSSGYEDYDIHELDFFINQLKCLSQVKN
jgi:hypothetical protein